MAGRTYSFREILVVEDDEAWQSRLTGLIKRHGYKVEFASTLDEAQLLFSKGKRFPALTVDIKLEEANGFQLLSALEFLAYTKRSQGEAIVISAYDFEEKALERGAYAFFNKATLDENKEKFLATLDAAVKQGGEQIALLEDRQRELTNQFLRGKDVEFLVPRGIENPWSSYISDSES